MKMLREPLLQFLLLGAGLFFLYEAVGRGDAEAPGRIVVTAGHVESVVATFARTWQRPPTQAELEGLIEDYVREEVLYREAMSLGLDRDDTIIRRRLRQKMEFISDDVADQHAPADEELLAYLEQHPDAFRIEERFTFRHVYLNAEQRGDRLQQDAERLLAELRASRDEAEVSALGDPFLLEHEFRSVPRSDVVKLFGEKFAAELARLARGTWRGPVASGYGAHLVFLAERKEGRTPGLHEVRDVVKREWANARRQEANEKFFQDLRRRYTVTVEAPASRPARTKVADVPR